jgi:hypothetical protein
MHQKYAKDGLVVMSVSLDPIQEDPASKDRAFKFLQAKGATFTNLLLDEPLEVWSERLHFVAPPCQFVFNKQGKWTKFEGGTANEVLEKAVAEALREK